MKFSIKDLLSNVTKSAVIYAAPEARGSFHKIIKMIKSFPLFIEGSLNLWHFPKIS